MTTPIPIFDSYWVILDRFLAGEYPGARDEKIARSRLRWLLQKNISFFLDLTEAGEYGLAPYAPWLKDEASVMGVKVMHHRLSIPDMNIPTVDHMRQILDALNQALSSNQNVYVHCYGGIGRTGTVVGCYLVQNGMTGEVALQKIAEWRQGIPDGWRTSPETKAQQQFVLNWRG